MTETDTSIDPSEEFIERMGLMTQVDGGPRIAGRMLGLAIVENKAMSLHEIAERLQVSKASVSTNARALSKAGLLRLTTRPGSREDLYELPPDPYRQLIGAITQNMKEKAAAIDEVEAKFSDEQADIRQRVRNLADFYKSSAEVLADWYEKLPQLP